MGNPQSTLMVDGTGMARLKKPYESNISINLLEYSLPCVICPSTPQLQKTFTNMNMHGAVLDDKNLVMYHYRKQEKTHQNLAICTQAIFLLEALLLQNASLK
jgi:hypothetical protein